MQGFVTWYLAHLSRIFLCLYTQLTNNLFRKISILISWPQHIRNSVFLTNRLEITVKYNAAAAESL